MEPKITEDEWDIIHSVANDYYRQHGTLINKMLKDVPKHLHDALLMKMSDMSSVYSHDIKE